MTPEQQTRLSADLANLAKMSVTQLFEAMDHARSSRASASEEVKPYWRALMIGIGNQLHRRLGYGAFQEYARHLAESDER